MGTMRLGSWGAKLNARVQLAIIEACLEAGINTFDLADIYGDYTAEADFGEALALATSLRDQIRIITKFGICRVCNNRPNYKVKHYDTSRAHIIQSVDNALRDLGTDRIDQLLIHRPDALMDVDEVAEAFTLLRDAGKVLDFGVSNFTPRQFDLLHSRFSLTTNQIEANLLHLDPFTDGTLDQMQQYGLRPQAWSPLGGGALFVSTAESKSIAQSVSTAESNNADNSHGPDTQILQIREVAAVLCEKYGVQLDQLLLAWLLRHPAGIRPVLGTSKIERIGPAVAAQDVVLSREDWYTLWSASTGSSVP